VEAAHAVHAPQYRVVRDATRPTGIRRPRSPRPGRYPGSLRIPRRRRNTRWTTRTPNAGSGRCGAGRRTRTNRSPPR
jgi:hypothetical protein